MVGGVVNQAIDGAINPRIDNSTVKCPKCNFDVQANAKFCLECGGKIEALEAGVVICSGCGKKTREGKFCMECGTTLMAKCLKCGNELPSGAKFCFECGEKTGGSA